MKKLIALCAVALSMGAFADDAYLYWMVSDSATWDVNPAPSYDTARVGVVDGTGATVAYLNIYNWGETTGAGSAQILSGLDNEFYANLGSYANSSYSYYIELLNDPTVVGKSAEISYSDATNYILASISQTDSPSSAAAWAPNFTATSAVPEPTSGMLLLFGLAGLALRRKRA